MIALSLNAPQREAVAAFSPSSEEATASCGALPANAPQREANGLLWRLAICNAKLCWSELKKISLDISDAFLYGSREGVSTDPICRLLLAAAYRSAAVS